MPCYLFTYRAYRSWMPDRPRGYVRRREGILPTNTKLADRYNRNAKYSTAQFQDEHQLAGIERLIEAVAHIKCRLHGVATDGTHIHALVSWNTKRTWQENRSSLKKALSIHFKERFEHRPWFVESASRKQVKDKQHFDYLMSTYLPSHRGWNWSEDVGLFKGPKRGDLLSRKK